MRRHFRVTLRPPRWQSVCSDMQVFRKNWINSSANANKKGARNRAPSESFSQQILTKPLALRYKSATDLSDDGAAAVMAIAGL
jgi:hypothetical protein